MLIQENAPPLPFKGDTKKKSPLPDGFSLEQGLAAIYDEPIVYIRQYAQAIQSVSAGYLLSYLTTDTKCGEWLPMSCHKIQEAIGLTKSRFTSSRSILLEKNVLENMRTVHPTQSLYRINDAALSELMIKHSSLQADDLGMPPLTIKRLHARTLSWLKLPLNSILYLAVADEMAEKKDFSERTATSNWMQISNKFLEQRTVLSKHEQLEAFKQLEKAGIIESRRVGFPASRELRISYERLAILTAQFLHRHQDGNE